MAAPAARRAAASAPHALNLHLHPKQWAAFESPATEVLFGGAAGGGKSHVMRVAAIVWCAAIPGLQVYLFRRLYDDLIKNHMDGPKGFRSILAPWVAAGWCRIVDDEVRFWNGSKIYLCHCQHEKDRFKYQGAEIHVLLIDELTHFTEVIYRFLRNRVRMAGIAVPGQYIGRFPRIVCGSNPGNIGHLWVKTTFITGHEPLAIRLMPANEGGMLRQYIPARLEDNPSLAEDDPGYENRLEGLGSETLVKAMRWGDWNVIEGAFFDCWNSARHVIAPFTVPRDWLRFRSGDWGSASPASIGWWAVVQDDFRLDGDFGGIAHGRSYSSRNGSDEGEQFEAAATSAADTDAIRSGRLLPRGALVRYREDYIASGPNRGLKLTAEQVAERIIAREKNDAKLTYGVLDPSAFDEDGGPSIAERLNGELIKKGLAAFRKADNKRVTRIQGSAKAGPMGGWDQLRARMIGDGKTPMIFCFSTCVESIRTIPALQHDPDRPEDLDTNMEDHAADEWRYAAMSRPWLKTPLAPDPPKDGYRPPSDDVLADSFKTL